MKDTEKKIYALRSKATHRNKRNGNISHRYWTGKKPSPTIMGARLFTMKYATSTKDFAHTGWQYKIIKVPAQVRFKMALMGI